MMTALWLLALIVTPDRAPGPDEWGYRPADKSVVEVNPPALTWVHDKGATAYDVQWAGSDDFGQAATVEKLRWPVYTHHQTLAPGRYWWRYRVHSSDGVSPWSKTRAFTVPASAVAFPKPTLDMLRKRVPKEHPRLFVTAGDLPRLRAYANGEGKAGYARLVERADTLLKADPTPEPKVKATPYDPATNKYWWSNRLETIQALQEAEVLSFVYLLTGDQRYGQRARQFALKLAAWDVDGPTNWKLNCEAAKPMLHRLARVYDWAWAAFTEEERARIRKVLLRRAQDAWVSSEIKEGVGHLSQPYSSHGNRTWHKLAETAIATLGETPESDLHLDYAVNKFFAAYPVWSDDDGGWHEGLSYFGGYMGKAAWWMDIAPSLGIDPFKKPFFAHFADYALYTAPPGSPDMGIGDLSNRPVSKEWSFFRYYTGKARNPYWAWWVDRWGIEQESGEPVLAFLWSTVPKVTPKPPGSLPPSKIFRGTGIAILNTTLLDAADNVQIRFKASPMGRWSHGHDPHNSFTLNAYGEQLLPNNVYRDLYGTPFHKDWVWSTVAQNAVLVNGQGQKGHTPEPHGRILKSQLDDGFDYVLGDATQAYEGKLTRAHRHILFVKPSLIAIVDELEAPEPSTYQWMLHGLQAFSVDEPKQRLAMDRGRAGVLVDYIAAEPLAFRQWDGYQPEPDNRYLKEAGRPAIPNQWHVEAASRGKARRAFTVTLLRPYRAGQKPADDPRIQRTASTIAIQAAGASLDLSLGGPEFAVVKRGGQSWRVSR